MRSYDITGRPDDTFPFAAEYAVAQGFFPEHTHSYTELLVVLSGTGWHCSDKGKFLLSTGAVVTVPPPLAHEMDKMKDLEMYVLKFDLNGLNSYGYDLRNHAGFRSLFIQCPPSLQSQKAGAPLLLDAQQLEHVRMLISTMFQEFSQRRPGYKIIIRTHLLALTAYLARCFLPDENALSLRMEKIIPTVTFMEENLRQKITIPQLAEQVFLSPRQYDRVFKEIYGTTPSSYLSELRLQYACQLMAERQCPLAQIWEKCGFTDNPFFYKKFKAFFGITPREYQQWLVPSIQD